jgi:hypothetical protein
LDGKNIVKEMILKDKVKELKSFVCLIKVYWIMNKTLNLIF